MNFVTVFDQWQQPWKIFENDPQWNKANEDIQANGGQPVYWSLSQLVQGRGWGWWTCWKKLDEFEADLERMMPHPGKVRLLDLDREYTPTELRDLLQRFGSYLSNLHHLEAMIEAQGHALRESYKVSMGVAIRDLEAGTLRDREAEVLSGSETFKQTKRMEIEHQSTLTLIKGWRVAYEQAWSTVSRLISLTIGEVQLQTSRST